MMKMITTAMATAARIIASQGSLAHLAKVRHLCASFFSAVCMPGRNARASSRQSLPPEEDLAMAGARCEAEGALVVVGSAGLLAGEKFRTTE
jgi:hypothetical protein